MRQHKTCSPAEHRDTNPTSGRSATLIGTQSTRRGDTCVRLATQPAAPASHPRPPLHALRCQRRGRFGTQAAYTPSPANSRAGANGGERSHEQRPTQVVLSNQTAAVGLRCRQADALARPVRRAAPPLALDDFSCAVFHALSRSHSCVRSGKTTRAVYPTRTALRREPLGSDHPGHDRPQPSRLSRFDLAPQLRKSLASACKTTAPPAAAAHSRRLLTLARTIGRFGSTPFDLWGGLR